MMVKLKPHFKEELRLWNSGIRYVIGIDEVGRGAFAGPIVAAGVIFKSNIQHDFLDRVNDSKLIKPQLREELSPLIKGSSIWAIEQIDIDFINKFGIGRANSLVLKNVLNKLISKLKTDNYFALVDGFDLRIPKQKAIVNGDGISLSIACASIIAKVYRDELMVKMHQNYPEYGFTKNKGYGTLSHREVIKKIGITKLHRTSFCKSYV